MSRSSPAPDAMRAGARRRSARCCRAAACAGRARARADVCGALAALVAVATSSGGVASGEELAAVDLEADGVPLASTSEGSVSAAAAFPPETDEEAPPPLRPLLEDEAAVASAAREELVERLRTLSDDELIELLRRSRGDTAPGAASASGGGGLARGIESGVRTARRLLREMPMERVQELAVPVAGAGALGSVGVVLYSIAGCFVRRRDAGGEGGGSPRAREEDAPGRGAGVIWSAGEGGLDAGAGAAADGVIWTRRDDDDAVDGDGGGPPVGAPRTGAGRYGARSRRAFLDNVE